MLTQAAKLCQQAAGPPAKSTPAQNAPGCRCKQMDIYQMPSYTLHYEGSVYSRLSCANPVCTVFFCVWFL